MWSMLAYWVALFIDGSYLHLLDSNRQLSYVLSAVAWIGILVTGVAAQVYRYFRVSTRAQRQQTKWVVLGWFIFLVGFLLAAVPNLSDPTLSQGVTLRRTFFLVILNLLTLILAGSIGIAILRSRLFDIDIIIRRTLTYAVVTGLLLAVFFGSVIVLQQLFAALTGSRQNELVTVLSTLAIAALFVPLRNRVQRAIDRRFNRNRYDAQAVLQSFGTTMRDETNLEHLEGQLVDVVQKTMQPRSISLWLKTEGGNERSR
jgi:hypothetical protein